MQKGMRLDIPHIAENSLPVLKQAKLSQDNSTVFLENNALLVGSLRQRDENLKISVNKGS